MRNRKRDRTVSSSPGPSPAAWRATVIGLTDVGLQLSEQLALLNVPLQLVDDGRLPLELPMESCYESEDAGRPVAHAAAHRCHRLSPQLEIATCVRSSLDGVKLDDAVFIGRRLTCEEQAAACDPKFANVEFAARCMVEGPLVVVHVARSLGSLPADPRLRSSRSKSGRYYNVVATRMAAALAVAEFVKFVMGRPMASSLRYDAGRRTLEVA